MIAIRSALYQLILLAVVIPYSAVVLATFPLPPHARWQVIAGWPRFALWLAERMLGIRYEVHGREHIPSRPAVILSKHQSAWETIAYTTIFPPHVYVLKRELFWIPFLGWGLALMSPIAINRSQGKQAMRRLIEIGGVRLAQGFSIMVYPEGTRIPVGRRGAYKLGGAVVAVQNGVPVVPVAHNAGLVWPRNSFLKYPGKVTVVIGAPIDTRGLAAEEVMRRVEDWIEAQVASLIPPEGVREAHAARTTVPG
ncbi:MAG: 1-acyl-sn-glycerol-3-phosphate acyltransferase [Burkholderiales bacterium]|nr:1-acyl-sn-glycerol-3-phosphate acyltransferase [Burkholderiales bacterium]